MALAGTGDLRERCSSTTRRATRYGLEHPAAANHTCLPRHCYHWRFSDVDLRQLSRQKRNRRSQTQAAPFLMRLRIGKPFGTECRFQVGLSAGSTGGDGRIRNTSRLCSGLDATFLQVPGSSVGYTRFPETIYASRPQVAVATADPDPGSFFPGPLVPARGGVGEPRFYHPPNSRNGPE